MAYELLSCGTEVNKRRYPNKSREIGKIKKEKWGCAGAAAVIREPRAADFNVIFA